MQKSNHAVPHGRAARNNRMAMYLACTTAKAMASRWVFFKFRVKNPSTHHTRVAERLALRYNIYPTGMNEIVGPDVSADGTCSVDLSIEYRDPNNTLLDRSRPTIKVDM